MTRDEIIHFYKVENGLIRSPGKFEDCPVWAPYYWDRGLAGFADDHDGRRSTFTVADHEREMFPELTNARHVHLVDDDQGFVHAEADTDEEFTDVTSRIVAYSYEGDVHCTSCARDEFGDALDNPNVSDAEGDPLGVVFATDKRPEGLFCGDCNEELIPPVWGDPALYAIRLSNSDDDPTQIIAIVEGDYADKWADHHGSLDGGTWESADGPTFVYDILYWRPGLFEELEADGYKFDHSEYSEPDEHDLAVARHASECEKCSHDWHKAEKHMESLRAESP